MNLRRAGLSRSGDFELFTHDYDIEPSRLYP